MLSTSTRLRTGLALGLIATAAACNLKDKIPGAQGRESGASAGDVNQNTAVEVTDAEKEAFKAPADSSLTPEQVEMYLRTSLLQFDLIRSEAPKMHQQVAEMEKRGKDGGVLSGLRNAAEGMQAIAHWGDFVGGSFVRSARTLKYNPAEMEYVRERMAAVSMHQMTAPMQMTGNAIRQQANAMKGQPGVTQEQIDEMLKQADEMDKATAPSPATQQNLNALRQARPNVSQQQWMNIGMAGGGMGLLALTGLGDPADTATARKLTEFRTLYTDALNNKTRAGMEDKKPEN